MSFTYFPALLEHTLTRVGLYLTIDVEYFRSLGIEHSVLVETLMVCRILIYKLIKGMDITMQVEDLTDFRKTVNFMLLEYTFLVRGNSRLCFARLRICVYPLSPNDALNESGSRKSYMTERFKCTCARMDAYIICCCRLYVGYAHNRSRSARAQGESCDVFLLQLGILVLFRNMCFPPSRTETLSGVSIGGREEAVDAPDFSQLMTAIQRSFQFEMGDPFWTDLFAASFWTGPLRAWECIYDMTILGNILYHLQSSGNLKVLFRLSCVEVPAACTH
eukprot:GHVU01016230.1.p1 GENE.GHVU01016230.1~~GHVU01016230.1.p1  ORF type:complete len:319 (-),score=1.18 GHVU01016230.1:866-1693(-)